MSLLAKGPEIVRFRSVILVAALLACQGAKGELVLFDEFDYAVARNPAVALGETGSAFVTQGPWTRVKAINMGNGTSGGYLYTVNSAEMAATTGYSGPLPGSGSRVLKIENPRGQSTDIYLEYSGQSTETIPGNVWFQFWVYSNHFGSELGGVENRHKFLYPSNLVGGNWQQSNKWLISFSSNSYMSRAWTAHGNPTDGAFYVISRDQTVGQPIYAPDPDNNDKLGANLLSESQSHIPANRWFLVKIHLDTSIADRGVFEAWIRPQGEEFRKIAEWIGGVTPNFTWGGFTPGGHRALRLPTTIGWSGSNPGVYYYIDDFAMATSEGSLPAYGAVRPQSPTNVAVE